jgi:hypothetical protein
MKIRYNTHMSAVCLACSAPLLAGPICAFCSTMEPREQARYLRHESREYLCRHGHYTRIHAGPKSRQKGLVESLRDLGALRLESVSSTQVRTYAWTDYGRQLLSEITHLREAA